MAKSPEKTPPDEDEYGLRGLYDVQKFLGKGAGGEAFLAKDCKTGEVVAIKLIKRPFSDEMIEAVRRRATLCMRISACVTGFVLSRECRIQTWIGLGHINVVPAKAVVLSKCHFGLIMEYEAGQNLTSICLVRDTDNNCAGGDMAHYISKRIPEGGGLCISEDEARFFFLQLVNAMEHCHKHSIAHRCGCFASLHSNILPRNAFGHDAGIET